MLIHPDCPDANALSDLVLGMVGDAGAESLEAHLTQCPRCLETVRTLRAEDTLVEALRGGAKIESAFDVETAEELMDRLCDHVAVDSDATWGHSAYEFLAPAKGPGEMGRLGQYRILRVLGGGGMGIVFQAEDTQLGRLVALKVMKPTLASRAASRQRFEREARAAAAVNSDHIITIYHVGEEGGVPYLAMELLHGESMASWLCKSDRPGVARTVQLAREIALGLSAAHERGLIHRDLKPGNVWLEAPTGRLKLLDFGLARAAVEDVQLTGEGSIVGTPAYMAPEQARGQKIDHRADLFSLGVVLYRLCTGLMPYRGETAMAVLTALAVESPTPVGELAPEVPPALADLVMQLLARDPAARPQSADEVVAALEAIEGATPSATAKPAGSAGKRRRLALIVATALLGCLFISAAAALIRIRSDRGDYLIETDDPSFTFQVNQGEVALKDLKTNKNYSLKLVRKDKGSGEMELELAEAGGDLSFRSKTVTIKRGERVVLKGWVERSPTESATLPAESEHEEAWLRWVAVLPREHKLQAVAQRLKMLNPHFDEGLWPQERDHEITGLRVSTENVTDLGPVLALSALEQLDCRGAFEQPNSVGPSRLSTLPPLHGLSHLKSIDFSGTLVSDLSSLKGTRLRRAAFGSTSVSDLTPLKGLPLEELWCQSSGVKDLSPLEGAPLGVLGLDQTQVFDLSPLKGMRLTSLGCDSTHVTDLSPLKAMPLRKLRIYNTPVSDLAPLQGLKLMSLNCTGSKVSDLAPLEGMPLNELWCGYTGVTGLSPLKGAPLAILWFQCTGVSDLAPLRGMPLAELCCGSTRVSDLSPLKGMALRKLYCDNTLVSELSTLRGLPLIALWCNNTRVTDLSPLKGMPLKELRCDLRADRDVDILRSIKTLETINQRPAADFWNAVDAAAARTKATAARATMRDQEKPFVVDGGEGDRQQFKTLAEALRGRKKNATVEVHGNGPFLVPAFQVDSMGLLLKAAPGYRPVLVAQIERGAGRAWAGVVDGEVLVDGCDFESGTSFQGWFFASGTGPNSPAPWTFRNCRFRVHGARGLFASSASRLVVENCLITGAFGEACLSLAPRADLVMKNNLIMAGGAHAIRASGNQTVELIDNFIDRGTTPLIGLPLEQSLAQPVKVVAHGNILGASPLFGDFGVGMPSAQFTRARADWEGRNNLYIHSTLPFLSFAEDKSGVKNLREWNQFWGRTEPGSVEQPGVGLQFTGWCSLSAFDQLRTVRQEVEELCGPLGSAARGTGPEWDLVGPGEAYVRALEKVAGKLLSASKRRPEPPSDGPFVVTGNRRELRGHASLQAALGAAQDGDTIEVRGDGAFPGAVLKDVKRAGRLLIRAAPGYQPEFVTQVILDVPRSDVEIEGFTFRQSPLAGDFSQLTLRNCAFKDAWGGTCTLHGSGETVRFVGCIFSTGHECIVGSGQSVLFENCIELRPSINAQSEDNDYEIKIRRSVFWAATPGSGALACDRNPKSQPRVLAQDSIFVGGGVLTGSGGRARWSGRHNVYSLTNSFAVFQEFYTLAAWQERWGSDRDSLVTPSPFLDPRMWRPLPGLPKRPDGKDYGADVDKVARTPAPL